MASKKVILVSGASGQLGLSLKENQTKYQQNFHFVFADRSMLDLSSEQSIKDTIQKVKPDIFLNFAAYTQVDKAQTETTEAFQINEKACALIAECCLKINCHLVHISTDYVFDGTKKLPYVESDIANPLNFYGEVHRIVFMSLDEGFFGYIQVYLLISFLLALPSLFLHTFFFI